MAKRRMGIFSFSLSDGYGLGNHLTEVVLGELCKDFLVDEVHLFCVKMEQSQGIFQITERGFNSPAHIIQTLDFLNGKRIFIKGCNNSFAGGFRNRETHNSEMQVIELGWVRLSGFRGKLIKATF